VSLTSVSEHAAIGVFDSGIGGLTVVRELLDTLPNERIVYFGDTARVPYGGKSVETIKRYAAEDTELLLAHDVKLIVAACNTVSANALEEVERAAGGVPVIGMIGPCAREALKRTKSGRIGIIGTEATIASRAYETQIARKAEAASNQTKTFSQACPLFVPLAEEGWIDHPATEMIVREYLAPLIENDIDTLILGCTHYPVLIDAIQRVVGPGVTLINSGEAAAHAVSDLLKPGTPNGKKPDHMILVSDVPRKFQSIGERFLGRKLPIARQVVFKEAWVIGREV
jgi:glutamate racemase